MSDTEDVERRKTDIERTFPKLRHTAWDLRSKADSQYNCVAYTLGDTINWWEPNPMGRCYWPPGLPRGDYSLQAYQTMFESLGYEVCFRGDLESGYVKIAIFAKQGRFSHVCLQRESGVWTSKLGRDDDIDHPLDALSGSVYGNPTAFLRKRIDS